MNTATKLRNYFAGRSVGYYLTLPALIFAVLAACLYSATGVTEFNPELNQTAIICLIVGAVVGAVSMAVDLLPLSWSGDIVKPLRYVSFLVILYADMQFILSQVTYIANVMVAIDGNTFTPGFLGTFICFDLAALFMLVAACLDCLHPWVGKTEHAGGELI